MSGDVAAAGFCPRCGAVVGTWHPRPACDAAYDAAYDRAYWTAASSPRSSDVGVEVTAVLAAHDEIGYELGYDDVDGCSCDARVRTHQAYRTHLAQALVPLIAAREAKAFDVGVLAMSRALQGGSEPRNPYRTDAIDPEKGKTDVE